MLFDNNNIRTYNFVNRFYLFIFREKGKEGGRKRGRDTSVCGWLPLARPPTGDLACNLGMCPDWESNW